MNKAELLQLLKHQLSGAPIRDQHLYSEMETGDRRRWGAGAGSGARQACTPVGAPVPPRCRPGTGERDCREVVGRSPLGRRCPCGLRKPGWASHDDRAPGSCCLQARHAVKVKQINTRAVLYSEVGEELCK